MTGGEGHIRQCCVHCDVTLPTSLLALAAVIMIVPDDDDDDLLLALLLLSPHCHISCPDACVLQKYIWCLAALMPSFTAHRWVRRQGQARTWRLDDDDALPAVQRGRRAGDDGECPLGTGPAHAVSHVVSLIALKTIFCQRECFRNTHTQTDHHFLPV